MTKITSGNSEISTLPVQIEIQKAPKAKTSELAIDLSKAAVCTVAWSALSLAGEKAHELIWGPNLSLRAISSKFKEDQVKFALDQLKSCQEKNWTKCTITPLHEDLFYDLKYHLKNTKVAAEFILASKLSQIAFKSIGFKPPAIVSLATGFAITVLLEADYNKRPAGVELSYKNLVFNEIAQTFSKAVVMPIFGAAALGGAVVVIPVALAFGLGSIAFLTDNLEIADTANVKPTNSEVQATEIAEPAAD